MTNRLGAKNIAYGLRRVRRRAPPSISARSSGSVGLRGAARAARSSRRAMRQRQCRGLNRGRQVRPSRHNVVRLIRLSVSVPVLSTQSRLAAPSVSMTAGRRASTRLRARPPRAERQKDRQHHRKLFRHQRDRQRDRRQRRLHPVAARRDRRRRPPEGRSRWRTRPSHSRQVASWFAAAAWVRAKYPPAKRRCGRSGSRRPCARPAPRPARDTIMEPENNMGRSSPPGSGSKSGDGSARRSAVSSPRPIRR
jgi:hypothetical protein